MQNLEATIEQIQIELDEKDAVREIALKSGRSITRLCRDIIHGIHLKEDVSTPMQTAEEEVLSLRSLLTEHPDLYAAGYVETAFQEMAEAEILYSILYDYPLKTPREMGISSTSFILGMGDVVGELRRALLDALRLGKVEDAVRLLEQMESLFSAIMRFNYPDAILAVRRKQDIARGILDKTRGDVALAIQSRALEEKMDDINRKLENRGP